MSGSSSTIKTRSMPDILPSYQEYNHFSNVCGVVADPLEMFSDKDQLDSARNRSRIFQHVGQELAKDLLVKIVDHVVVEYDFLGELRVRIDECIEALFENLLSGVRHNGQVHQPLQFRLLHHLDGALADIDRNIADT